MPPTFIPNILRSCSLLETFLLLVFYLDTLRSFWQLPLILTPTSHFSALTSLCCLIHTLTPASYSHANISPWNLPFILVFYPNTVMEPYYSVLTLTLILDAYLLPLWFTWHLALTFTPCFYLSILTPCSYFNIHFLPWHLTLILIQWTYFDNLPSLWPYAPTLTSCPHLDSMHLLWHLALTLTLYLDTDTLLLPWSLDHSFTPCPNVNN